jgi:hypothetical protein
MGAFGGGRLREPSSRTLAPVGCSRARAWRLPLPPFAAGGTAKPAYAGWDETDDFLIDFLVYFLVRNGGGHPRQDGEGEDKSMVA